MLVGDVVALVLDLLDLLVLLLDVLVVVDELLEGQGALPEVGGVLAEEVEELMVLGEQAQFHGVFPIPEGPILTEPARDVNPSGPLGAPARFSPLDPVSSS